MSDARWSVSYGNRDEWFEWPDFDSEVEARAFFARLCEQPVDMGSYPMDYAILYAPGWDAVDSWSACE